MPQRIKPIYRPFSIFNLNLQPKTTTLKVRAMAAAAAEESAGTMIEMLKLLHRQGQLTEAEARFIIKQYSNS